VQQITTSSRPIHLLTQNETPFLQNSIEKIHRLIPSFLQSIATGNFFSSKQFYQCVQVTLISASFIGVLGSMGLLATGMAGVSLVTITLSITTAIGAYIAHLASLQQTFVENALEMRNQVDAFSKQNKTLKKTTEELTQQNSKLELQHENYKALEKQLQDDIGQLQRSNEQNIETFTNRIKEFSQQVSASKELWDQVAKEKTLFNRDQTAQLASLKQIVQEISDPKTTLLRLEEHQRISKQIQEAVAELKKIKQQLEDINHQVSVKEGQLKERDDLLATLQEKHQRILSVYEQQNGAFASNVKDLSQISALVSQEFRPT
jgi:chromosome segregation ATPase